MLGCSFDNQADNAAFASKYGFPFLLLCDTERSMGLAYGACDAVTDGYARRLTFVISPEGVLEEAIETQDPGGQAAGLLARYGSV